MSKRTPIILAGLAVLSLCGSGLAQDQDVTPVVVPQDVAGTSAAELTIATTLKTYDVTFLGGFPNNYAFMFMSTVTGPWLVDMGSVIGKVGLDVLTPIDFLLGITDDAGSVVVPIVKPLTLPRELIGAVAYCQVVSMEYTVDAAADPMYSFSFRVSNVAPIVLDLLHPSPH